MILSASSLSFLPTIPASPQYIPFPVLDQTPDSLSLRPASPIKISATAQPMLQTTIPLADNFVTSAPVVLPPQPVVTLQSARRSVPKRSRAEKKRAGSSRHQDDYDDQTYDFLAASLYYNQQGCKYAPRWCGIGPQLVGLHRFFPDPLLLLALLPRLTGMP
jgi:hypothetical protein